MDFIDPQTQRKHKILLLFGYGLLAIAIILTTVILLYQANGYGFGKQGEIIQNGLVFLSSNPSPAQITLNGVTTNSQTNLRLQLPAGSYTVQLTRSGYRPWVRVIGVEGGSVEHFDYPFLFPNQLVTTNIQQYDATNQTQLVTQSPDRHWLLVQQAVNPTTFTEYDVTNSQAQLVSSAVPLSLPKNIATADNNSATWQVVQWSTDNRHALLLHNYTGGSEYIMLDRQVPASSLNLTQSLNLKPGTQLSLADQKYDQYYLFNPTAQTLNSMSLATPQPTAVLTQVLAYKSYATNVFLYVTTQNAPAGKVNVDILQDSATYVLRQVSVDSRYLLDITQYSGHWYAGAGAASENKVYVYKDPVSNLQNRPTQPLVPVWILKPTNADYISFSPNAQFIVAEGGTNFAVYDAENQKGYAYQLTVPIAGQLYATWMDGNRLVMTSNNNVIVFDYDGANQQTLQPAVTGTVPFFDPNYKWAYALAPLTSGGSLRGSAGTVANGSSSAFGTGQATHSSSIQSAQFVLTGTALSIPPGQ